ncbi:MAG TPA: hypothetical protein VE753_06505 [Gaiellaceae bacterium]|jgi:hypothetical protein|nr:hypothetical protein [Gaiellaceae bacterium]
MHRKAREPSRIPVLQRLRGARLWLLLVLGGVAIALFPWTAYLSATLPGEHVTRHWDVAWAGFDLFEAAALAGTLLALVRRSPRLPLAAAVAGTALLCDAWFDLITAAPGRELRWALLQAVPGELPLAALCFWIAVDSTGALATAAVAPASGAGPRPTAPRGRPAGG